jgi:hypothetical protein
LKIIIQFVLTINLLNERQGFSSNLWEMRKQGTVLRTRTGFCVDFMGTVLRTRTGFCVDFMGTVLRMIFVLIS